MTPWQLSDDKPESVTSRRYRHALGALLLAAGVGKTVVRETAREEFFVESTRRAFLVSDDMNYGMCRMYATHAEAIGQVVAIFRDRDAAEAWLDLRG